MHPAQRQAGLAFAVLLRFTLHSGLCFGQHDSQSKSLSAQEGFRSLALEKVEIFSPLKGSFPFNIRLTEDKETIFPIFETATHARTITKGENKSQCVRCSMRSYEKYQTQGTQVGSKRPVTDQEAVLCTGRKQLHTSSSCVPHPGDPPLRAAQFQPCLLCLPYTSLKRHVAGGSLQNPTALLLPALL